MKSVDMTPETQASTSNLFLQIYGEITFVFLEFE